jgi:hypothetical protein
MEATATVENNTMLGSAEFTRNLLSTFYVQR